MKLKSLWLRSNLMFFEHNAIVEAKKNYIVVKTPDNPSYFWGNFLIYYQGPKDGDHKKWREDFSNEFSSETDVKHEAFTWDIDNNYNSKELYLFRDRGFEYDETIVLVAEKKLNIQHRNNDFIYKRIVTEEEWNKVIDLQVLVNSSEYKEIEYRPFVQKRFSQYRRLAKIGLGHWFGAFRDGCLVADLGLFCGYGIGIFQNIETRSEFRKRGIAQSLMNYAVESLDCCSLVIEADEDGPAINMYKTIGFKVREKISDICLYDRTKWKEKDQNNG